MADTLALFRSFVRVVEAGSFTAVARELGSSQPTVSRQIAQLEAHLGARLFQRSTRALALTEEGRAFYAQAVQALDMVAAAEGAVGKRRDKPTGTLRLAAAVVLGRLHIAPRLPRFLARHPDVGVDLAMSDAFADLVEEGIDLAVRVGEIDDRALVARRIGTTRRAVVATPGYLARFGEPKTPDDLRRHQCVLYSRLATGSSWPLVGKDGPIAVPVQGRVRMNNTEGVRAAVLEGLGIGLVPLWHFVDREIARGKLKVLLAAYAPPPHPINAVYLSRRHTAPKIRAMIDYLAAEFASDPLLRIK